MKRQSVILATLIISAFVIATIFAEVSAAQQPVAPTAKVTAVVKDCQNLRGPQYSSPRTYWYYPPPVYKPPLIMPGKPPVYQPPYYPPPVWREVSLLPPKYLAGDR